jgi:uncharacterized DUF497 family protein
MRPQIERTFISRRVREKLRKRGIEAYHVNQAIRTRETLRRARYGAYLAVGRDETDRRLLVVFHLRGNIAHIATARRVN